MENNTIYLITGANRGIGRAMVAALLLRPSTTVVATVRSTVDPTSESLSTLPTASNSHLVVIELDSTGSSSTYKTLSSTLASHGIVHLDVLVANAGSSSGFRSILETSDKDILNDFEINTLGPVKLFQTFWPLLKNSQAKKEEGHKTGPKFVVITSSVGSISVLDQEGFPSTAYGMSKAAVNWFAKKCHAEFKNDGLSVGILHPGWVKTPMGQSLADIVGLTEPPTTPEESADGLLIQIDKLSNEAGGSSGQFLNYRGEPMPW